MMKLKTITKAHQITFGKCCKTLSLKDAEAAWKKDGEHVYEVKENGSRRALQIRPNGSNQNYLVSRRVSKQTGVLVEKQDSVPHVRDFKFHVGLNDTVFDGEWVGGKNAAESQHALAEGRGEYVVWDLIRFRGNDLTKRSLSFRVSTLWALKELGRFPKWMRLIKRSKDPKELFDWQRKNNTEGVIRKNTSAPYGEEWERAKKLLTADVIIWGYLPTKSPAWKAKNWIGSLLIGQWQVISREEFLKKKNDLAVRARPLPKQVTMLPGVTKNTFVYYRFVDVGRCSNFNEKWRALFSAKQQKYLGEVIEVEANDRYEDTGKFQHPRFERMRNDKNAIECIWQG